MHNQLLDRRNELVDGVSGEGNLLSGLGISSEPGDSVDQASDSLEGEISAQLADVEFREIANIDEALRRMNDKTYGVCEACRKNIPVKRLEAIPHASFCIDCKRLTEQHEVDEGSAPNWSVILGFEEPADPDVSVS